MTSLVEICLRWYATTWLRTSTAPRCTIASPSGANASSRDDRDVGLGARPGCTRRRRRTARATRRDRRCRAARRGTAGPGAGTPRPDARPRTRARRRRCRSCARSSTSTSRYSTDDPLRSPTSRAGGRSPAQYMLPAARREQVGVHELAHRVVEAGAEPALVVGRERQLVRRARDLGAQHERVLRVHDRALGRAARRARRDARRTTGRAGRRRRRARPPTRRPVRPARPACCHIDASVPGKAVEHDRVEPADVDAELERVRGRDAEQPAAREVELERAPFLGRDSRRGTPRRGRPSSGATSASRRARVLRDDLGAAPAARERERLVAGARRSGSAARRSRRWPTRARPSARRAAGVASTRARVRRAASRRRRSARPAARTARDASSPGLPIVALAKQNVGFAP